MAWVGIIPAEDASGDLLTFCSKLGLKSGPVGSPWEVLTQNGAALLRLEQLDNAVRFKAVALSRLRIEMIACLVSAINHCVF